MNEEELARSLETSVNRRVAQTAAQPRPDELLARLERRDHRTRQRLIGGFVLALLVVGVGAFALGRSGQDADPARVVASLDDGTPPTTAPTAARVTPADPVAARAQIAQAFHDAFTGGIPQLTVDAALQDGTALRTLRRQVLAFALANGYTRDQLDGTTIKVLKVDFIDEAHAVVHFTLSMPGRGDLIVDRAGYAVFDTGRWRVALRTACDLLSLDGFIGTCPPAGS